jgi:tape measure domain-containing protein
MILGATITLKDRFTPVLKNLSENTKRAESGLRGLAQVKPIIRIRDEATLRVNEIKRGLRSLDRFVVRPTIRVAGFGLGVGRSLLGAATSLPALLGMGAGAYGGIISPLRYAGEMEQTRIGFETMLGSAEKAASFIKDLQSFSAKTPFEFPELQESSKLLLAFGFQAEQVLPMMEAIGNAAAGLGKGSEGINRAVIALGQMRAKGKVSAEEMLQLTELGIPAWEILAEAMSVNTKQAQELVSKGVVPVDKAIQALVIGMNKRFPDMMKRQNRSMLGLWSNIKDVFSQKVLLKWGEGLSLGLMPRLEKLADWLDKNEGAINTFGQALQDMARQGADALLVNLEGAFKNLHGLFSNPEFTRLDFWGKVNFLWDEVTEDAKVWFNNGGKEKFTQFGLGVAEFIGKGIGTMIPIVAESAAKSFLAAFEKTLTDSYLGAMIVGGIAGWRVGGPLGIAPGVASAFTTKAAKDTTEAVSKNVKENWQSTPKPPIQIGNITIQGVNKTTREMIDEVFAEIERAYNNMGVGTTRTW